MGCVSSDCKNEKTNEVLLNQIEDEQLVSENYDENALTSMDEESFLKQIQNAPDLETEKFEQIARITIDSLVHNALTRNNYLNK